jgi:GNAT superfamily N-acetyltransferase
MTNGFHIAPVRTEEDIAAATALFAGYAASLPVDLGYQDFGAELAALPGKYAPPLGELLLARDDRGTPLGCVGLRPIPPEGCCEMKRLFLLPTARGLGLGRAMTGAVIETARRLGYRELRLDTLPTMTTALKLYAQMGFARIGPYYAPTPSGTVFMALRL